MPATTQHGYLVLADISGYTSFLAGTELEHSHEIMSELLELIVERFRTLLTIAKLEGDAVFAYAPETKIQRGETLLELLETTYAEFRDRQVSMHRLTTCTCNACRAIPTLDLKFMAHHGDYIVQNVAGIQELAGSDVNLVHRLLKNHVSEATGWKAYALFTAKSLDHMRLKLEEAHAQVETYEHLGDTQTYSLNLHEHYKEITEARRIVITPAEAHVVAVWDFPAPPPVIWEWLNDPLKRTLWGGGATWTATSRPKGRTGLGARNHCAHGKESLIETVLDWRPFNYVTAEGMENNKATMMKMTKLEPLPDGRGTRVSFYFKMYMPLPHWLVSLIGKFVVFKVYKFNESLALAARLVGEEMARETAVVGEPLPAAA